jgi:hypothetical protein
LLLTWKSKFALSPLRRSCTALLRALVVLLVVLAVADLRIAWPTRELSVSAIIDRNPSVAQEEQRALEASLTRAAEAHTDASTRIIGAQNEASLDIALQLGAAVATMPEDRVRRVLLATDGRDPEGNLPSAIAAAREAGVEVSTLPMGSAPPVDSIAISHVETPRLVRASETVDVGFTMHAASERRVRVEALLDGMSVASSEIDVPEGSSSHRMSVTFPDTPLAHELELVAHADGIALNDRWRSLTFVLPKPRVRIYHAANRPEPALARVLRDSGMEVEAMPPGSAFTEAPAYDPYALVITDEIDLGDFTEAQQSALRNFVEEQGGGLVTVTGSHPVRRTPHILREIEPVEPPPALPEPRPLELVIVIDRSSSMSGMAMEQARRAGVAAVRSLRRDALVGAVAFSSAADRIQPPVPMDRADTVIGFIQGVHASGGTNIAAAIQAANRIMSSDPRYIHHVILVSDGESEPQSAIAAAMALAGRGVSISTITIGSYSQLLSEIARIGRGRYHTTTASGLTSLVVSEAMYRQPPANRQISFRPRVEAHLPMLSDVPFESIPMLSGHALAGAKRGATVALSASERMPLFAHWHRGLGQVATFTSATSGGWADQMRAWPGFRTFWSSVAKGMLRNRTIEKPQITVETDPVNRDRRIVTITSPFLSMDAPEARIFRDASAGTPLALTPKGPGVFQAEVPIERGFLVTARMPFDPDPAAAEGDEEPYPRALRAFGPDAEALERLASLGGGRVLEEPSDIFETSSEALVRRALRTPLLVLALLTYLASLLLLRMPDRRLGRALDHSSEMKPKGRPMFGRRTKRANTAKRKEAA